MTIAIASRSILLGSDLEPVAGTLVIDTTIAAVETPISTLGGALDANQLTLLPGFIDAHVHIGCASPSEVLGGGVTTARDLGWPPELIWPVVDRSRRDDFDGPVLLAVGQMLTVREGYPTRAPWAPEGTGRAVASPDEARLAVEDAAASGACAVKVALNAQAGPTLSPELLRAIVEAAHARDLKVTGHVFGLDELHKALDAGMDELAHMLMSDEEIPISTIEQMVAAGMTIVPTLSCRFGGDRDRAIENLRRFVAAGGRVVYGTDLGNDGPRPGIDAREIDGMVRAGMTGRDIIASGTYGSASYLGLEDRGTIELGRRADVIGVAGDPLADPMALTDVRLVLRGGRLVRVP
jgi:imidazolonepropionase-like amidohydrolase